MHLLIDGIQINGPYNDNNFNEAFVVIDWEMDFERTFELIGGDPSPSQIIYKPIKLIKNIDAGSPHILKGLRDNSPCEAHFHLLTLDGNGACIEYSEVILTNAKIGKVQDNLVHIGNGSFAHLETIYFYPTEVSFEDKASGNVFNYNYATGSALKKDQGSDKK